jgi:hypothetical protein
MFLSILCLLCSELFLQEKFFFNVKIGLLPLLVIIDFPYGKLVKTTMFNIYQENTIISDHCLKG